MCSQNEQVQLLGWPIPNNSYPTTANRLFANGGYDIPLSCWPGTDCKEGMLRDVVGAAETVVYEVGCNGPPPWANIASRELIPRNGTDQIAPPVVKSCANRRVTCDDSIWGDC
jgi:hypothetical protein